jgi:predicted DNA-binding transcriptional regulator AlpA
LAKARSKKSSAASSHPLRLFRTGRLAALIGVNESTIWKWRKSGVLPPPIQIGSIHGWTEEQVRELYARRRRDRGAA